MALHVFLLGPSREVWASGYVVPVGAELRQPRTAREGGGGGGTGSWEAPRTVPQQWPPPAQSREASWDPPAAAPGQPRPSLACGRGGSQIGIRNPLTGLAPGGGDRAQPSPPGLRRGPAPRQRPREPPQPPLPPGFAAPAGGGTGPRQSRRGRAGLRREGAGERAGAPPCPEQQLPPAGPAPLPPPPPGSPPARDRKRGANRGTRDRKPAQRRGHVTGSAARRDGGGGGCGAGAGDGAQRLRRRRRWGGRARGREATEARQRRGGPGARHGLRGGEGDPELQPGDGHVGDRRPEVPGAESKAGEGERTGQSDHQEGGPGANHDRDGDLTGGRRAQPARAHGQRGGGTHYPHQLSAGAAGGALPRRRKGWPRRGVFPHPIKALVGLGCGCGLRGTRAAMTSRARLVALWWQHPGAL